MGCIKIYVYIKAISQEKKLNSHFHFISLVLQNKFGIEEKNIRFLFYQKILLWSVRRYYTRKLNKLPLSDTKEAVVLLLSLCRGQITLFEVLCQLGIMRKERKI